MTTLVKDLGVTGDDGDEFMEAFFKEFSIDPYDFDSSRYFGPEGFDPIGLTALLRKVLRQPPLGTPLHDIGVLLATGPQRRTVKNYAKRFRVCIQYPFDVKISQAAGRCIDFRRAAGAV